MGVYKNSLIVENFPTYRVWRSMKSRCNNPCVPGYVNYGGRGIEVCDRWASFEIFLKDMGKRPSLDYTLDRVDNNGNYEPSNCRWANWEQQRNNARGNKPLTFNGETLNQNQMARKYGINEKTFRGRLSKGLTLERACLTPTRKQRPRG